MKFVLSFSAGKDSVLALHRMVAQGHKPAALLVMFNRDAGRSWFHGADRALLCAMAESLRLPLVCCEAAGGADYEAAFERCLRAQKEQGVEACVFGDIDLEAHRRWNEARCAAAGLRAELPLWGESREELVREVVGLGYRCVVKCVRQSALPERFLGRVLDLPLLEELRGLGVDLCGENGEYHTVVLDGPLFHAPVRRTAGEILRLGEISAIRLDPC